MVTKDFFITAENKECLSLTKQMNGCKLIIYSNFYENRPFLNFFASSKSTDV